MVFFQNISNYYFVSFQAIFFASAPWVSWVYILMGKNEDNLLLFGKPECLTDLKVQLHIAVKFLN